MAAAAIIRSVNGATRQGTGATANNRTGRFIAIPPGNRPAQKAAENRTEDQAS
jgi:hypothetical protein